jgi:hypothetical protein
MEGDAGASQLSPLLDVAGGPSSLTAYSARTTDQMLNTEIGARCRK